MEYLVVDGYNILNAWPELEKLKALSFEHARDHLIGRLANYGALTGIKVVIVFDAHLVKGGSKRQEEVAGSLVIFTREDETADMAIEKLVDKLPGARQVFVATSDQVEQRIILGKGACRISARELCHQVIEAENKAKQAFVAGGPGGAPLDRRLPQDVRNVLEKWRRRKDNGPLP